MPEMLSEHLSGPWQAFLAAEDGSQVFASLADVPADVEVAITILRGETLAAALSDEIPDGADDVNEMDVLYLLTPSDINDWEEQLPARWEQAKAVAAGLNERTELERLRAAVRRVVSITQDTDGDSLDIDETVPVGEVLRMLYEFHEDVVERAFLSRRATEPGA